MGNSAAAGRLPRPRSAILLRLASDERLVELVRAGSEAAFEAIYDRHHRSILAFCRHMLGSADEGEDALQHTFMAAYRHLTTGDADIQLRPWLYAIARNRCLSMLRARRERSLEEYHEPSTEHLSAEAQRRQDVREVLADVAALPDDQRAALVLAELGAVSHEEIALVLEVPRQKVKALVFQARTSLAASRTARETPCADIREQLANLRGGALRRTTLHRHLRECPGCRAFREEVAIQRRTLAIALPVMATPGLKEAALGAAFGSAGGGAAAAGGGAVAAKALVAVALVGGGTTAGVEVARHAQPSTAPKAAPAKPAPPAGGVRSVTAVSGPARAFPAPVSTAPPATPRRLAPAREDPRPAAYGKRKQGKPAHAVLRPAKPERVTPTPAAREQAKGKPETPPGQAKAKATKPAPREAVERAPTPPGQAKAKPTPPGLAKKLKPAPSVPAPAEALPPGQAKKLGGKSE
jgi:RNA polymerase sigma factor (sigma-70 family)